MIKDQVQFYHIDHQSRTIKVRYEDNINEAIQGKFLPRRTQ